LRISEVFKSFLGPAKFGAPPDAHCAAATGGRRRQLLLLQQLVADGLLMPVPYFAWELLAAVLAPLPNRPISRDQVVLMKRDNVVGPTALSFADLGLAPSSVEEILPCYFRTGPRHAAK
jgi:hypothetical protein